MGGHDAGEATTAAVGEVATTAAAVGHVATIAYWLEIVHRASAPRGGEVPIPALEILQYISNSNNSGTKTQINRVDTAPQGVETPTQLAGC